MRANRFRLLMSLFLGLLLVAGSLPTTTFAQSEAPGAARFDPLAPPSGVTAKAVYVEDATADSTLYSFNADERRSPASTTKLMTALVIANNTTDWQELVTTDASDVLTIEDGQSMVGLLDGDVLTVEQMMYGLMLPSGNDSAHAMARFIGAKLLAQESADGDPYDRFVQEMNNTVAALGLPNTHFTNPSGLYDEEHYTSARDLAVIAAEAYAIPIVEQASAAATYELSIQGPNARTVTITNTNKLLGQDGVVAGKTGTLMESLACLVILRKEGANMIVGVVLGSEIEFDQDQIQIPETDHRFTDMSTILSAMGNDFRWVQPGDESFPGLSKELAVWDVRLGDNSAIVLPATSTQALRYLLQLGPPAQPGSPVGNLLIFNGDQIVAEKPVLQGGAPQA